MFLLPTRYPVAQPRLRIAYALLCVCWVNYLSNLVLDVHLVIVPNFKTGPFDSIVPLMLLLVAH
jgi:hypothetical protein